MFMATFTITTSQNIDQLASKAGNDIYNINGGYLTVDQDSRYGTNNNTSASMGNITMSATLGGTVEFNATQVRLIAFTGGSGNVPASNTVISNNGASGKLIGVYSALTSAPTAAAAAMPASGFIKVKQVTGTYAAGALTGITATSSGIDTPGWIEIVGTEAATATVNRLNTFKIRGDWYYFQGTTTSGVNTTTYQIPSNGSAVYCPGVWVESATSDVYDFYPCAGTSTALAATVSTDYDRGRRCWISSAGLVRFQHDGTNSTGGYLPPSGRKIRIPNIIFTNATSAAPTTNALPNATLATRYDFTTTGGGTIDIDKCLMNWYPSFTQAYSVNMSNIAVATAITVAEIASPMTWDNVNVGHEAANAQIALTKTLCLAGGTFTNCVFKSASLAASGRVVCSMADIDGFDYTNCEFSSLIYKSIATTSALTITRGNNCDFINTRLGAGKIALLTCNNINFNNTFYYAHPATIATSAMTEFFMDIGSASSNITIDGYDNKSESNYSPYSGLFNISAAGCKNVLIKNIGTASSPLNLGKIKSSATWTRSTTTATVTTPSPHGLVTGALVYVDISSDIAAIVIGSKTITVTSTTTFTFTCLNAGAASGTLTFFGTISSNALVIASGSSANNIRMKRCYIRGLRTSFFSGDNSSKNVALENCQGDFLYNEATSVINCDFKAVGMTHALGAQTACYGTDWIDYYLNDYTTNNSNVSWTRATTTITITSANHNLRTGSTIQVNATSSATAIPTGTYSITALTIDTFNITGLNAGATSGTLSFSPLTARLALLFNEPTSSGVVTINSGTPAFTSAGSFYMPTIGMQATFEAGIKRLGYSSFLPTEAVMAGGTLTNYNIEYSIDNGTGFGSFKNLSYVRTGASGTSGQSTFTVTSATGINVDDYVFGTGISPLAKVVSINANTVTVNLANTATVSGTVRFNQLPNETIPVEGFKLKYRITTITTNTTAMTSLYVNMGTDSNSRSVQYPLDPIIATLSFTGIKSGSEIRIFTRDGSGNSDVELTGNENITNGTFSYTYNYEAPTSVNIVIVNNDYQYWSLNDYPLTASNASIPVQQIIDRPFKNS